MAHRFHRDFRPTFHPERLSDPLHWRRPRRIGVSFTGDLFDTAITDEQIASVFGVMAACPAHTFFVLTKQAARMERWFARPNVQASVEHARKAVVDAVEADDAAANVWARWPLPNVAVGVSVSTAADLHRIDNLLCVPAALRFISAEPLLGPLDLGRLRYHLVRPGENGVNWVVVAAESGPRARPVNLDWVRQIRDDCAECDDALFALKDQTKFLTLDGVRHAAIPSLTPPPAP